MRETFFFTHNFCLTKWFLSTRLVTRTKESNVRASIMVRKTMMHYESTTVVASLYVIARGEKRDCLKYTTQEFSPWHHRPVWKAQRNTVLSPCVFLSREGKCQRKSNKGLSQSTYIRTRKMVIYACVGARSEETLMEALV